MVRCFFFFSSRRRHTRLTCDWSSDVCSSDLVWFSRTTNGAGDNPTWESREIFDPGTKSGTISNQIVVAPDGTLVDGFYLFRTQSSHAGNFVAVIRSTDKAGTWPRKGI